MKKRRASIDPAQLGFTFDPPAPARRDADLAGLDRGIAATVGLALKEDARSRDEIAGAMSALLATPVTKLMLDAYASEAREQHSISAGRLLALVAVTERFDLLDALLRRIGAAVLVGEELRVARLGHLRAQKLKLDEEIRKLSWPMLAKFIGLAHGTLSTFGTNHYAGNQQKIAQAIFRYRQTLDSQAVRATGILQGPGFFETKTSTRIRGLLTVAHGGRITLGATSPGTGKTKTATEYARSASNVTYVSMRKSTKTVNGLSVLVLRAMGMTVKGGWGGQLAEVIIDRLRNRNALLIAADEERELSFGDLREAKATRATRNIN